MIIFYNLLALLRAVTFIITALVFFITTIPLYPFYLANTDPMRSLLTKILSLYVSWCLFFMGIRIGQRGITTEIKEHLNQSSYLIISNHMSYLDVLAIAAFIPSSFVTSVEIRDTPFLGHICKLIGCVFVERRNKKNIGDEIKEIEDTLEYGTPVTIFPEATSTNGDEVIRFKRPLFRAAMESNTQVLPITVNYESLNNQSVTIENRDYLCWYGDMTFADHIWGIFKTPTIDLSITVSSPLRPEDYQDHVELSETAHARVSQNYRPFQAKLRKLVKSN